MDLVFKIKTASTKDIYNHLLACNKNFTPALNQTVNLADYSKKIKAKSVTFEIWDKKTLVGLIACYVNLETSFITNVSTISTYNGMGIASKLIENCINYSKQKNIKEIKLEVNRLNDVAIRIYNRFGFTIFEYQDKLLTMKLEL